MTYYKIASGSLITPPQPGDLIGVYRPVNSDNNRQEFLVNSSSFSYTDNPTISAAATDLLYPDQTGTVQIFAFAAGGGAYVYNIDLSNVYSNGSPVQQGTIFKLNINKAASTNPTINVRDGSGGANIISINNASLQDWDTEFMFDGTNWFRMRAVINSL